MAQTRHAGTWTIEDRCESTWHYLPVEVPAGASALRVQLDYDAAGAALDLGCFGPAGFRGWSGGARRSFVIAAGSATPGYLPGELEPGTWQIIIGLHRVASAGTRYELSAEASGGQVPRMRTERVPPLPSGRPAARCRRQAGCAGWPVTCTRTLCIPTAS